MEQDPVPQPLRPQRDDLPIKLVAELPPKAQDALNSPLRRQILRTLNECREPRTPGEIAATTTPGATVSVISYHAQVLEGGGCVAVAGIRPVRGGLARLYTSRVTGNEQVAAVLRATRRHDRGDGVR